MIAATFALLQHDEATGAPWLRFPRAPRPEVRDLLKARGWRWSRYFGAWTHPSPEEQPPTGIRYAVTNPGTYSTLRTPLEARAWVQRMRAEVAERARARALAHALGHGGTP